MSHNPPEDHVFYVKKLLFDGGKCFPIGHTTMEFTVSTRYMGLLQRRHLVSAIFLKLRNYAHCNSLSNPFDKLQKIKIWVYIPTTTIQNHKCGRYLNPASW